MHRHRSDNGTTRGQIVGADGNKDVGKHVTDAEIMQLRREGSGEDDSYSSKLLKYTLNPDRL